MAGNDAVQFGMAAALSQAGITLQDAKDYTDAAIASVPGGGDVVADTNPSVDLHFVQYDGITGKHIKDGGYAPASFDVAGAAAAAITTAATHSDNASNLSSGTIPNARISALPNANLANSAITINGHATSLGGSVTLAPGDLACASGLFLVGNGSNVAAAVAMSGDVTITNAGVATIKTSVALAGSPTTTTQTLGDSSTKVATTAFVAAATAAVPVAGTTPSIVQSKIAVANSASITLSAAPTNGNLLVAMCFNPTNGTAGTGWTNRASNSSGTDFGLIVTKVAGAGESATQTPLAGAGNGVIAMWEINGQAATFTLFAASQAEQAGLFATPPQTPNVVNCITLGCVSLVSTSNNILALYNMVQDQIIQTGTTRQGVMGHSFATTPIGQPIVTFDGTGSPGNKSGVIMITH